jgi:hypothetical protein
MKPKTVMTIIAGAFFWPAMIWLGYHFDWTLPLAILSILIGSELSKRASDPKFLLGSGD